jgi:hypothetical protein
VFPARDLVNYTKLRSAAAKEFSRKPAQKIKKINQKQPTITN